MLRVTYINMENPVMSGSPLIREYLKSYAKAHPHFPTPEIYFDGKYFRIALFGVQTDRLTAPELRGAIDQMKMDRLPKIERKKTPRTVPSKKSQRHLSLLSRAKDQPVMVTRISGKREVFSCGGKRVWAATVRDCIVAGWLVGRGDSLIPGDHQSWIVP